MTQRRGAAPRKPALWHEPWEEDAACADRDDFTDWKIKTQLAVCLDLGEPELEKRKPCPVRMQCLELGLAQPLHAMGPKGMTFVYGGVTPTELHKIKKKRQKKAA